MQALGRLPEQEALELVVQVVEEEPQERDTQDEVYPVLQEHVQSGGHRVLPELSPAQVLDRLEPYEVARHRVLLQDHLRDVARQLPVARPFLPAPLLVYVGLRRRCHHPVYEQRGAFHELPVEAFDPLLAPQLAEIIKEATEYIKAGL